MNEQIKKVSEETMRFMRGKYVLDELWNAGKPESPYRDELKFRRAGKTVLTIYVREGRYDFVVIFGKAERVKFEVQRDAFPRKIQDIYDNAKTYHDGKWMLIPVADLETLEAVKGLILIKKKPNRKPFPKERTIYSDCGHRCDLCVHGSTISEEFREELKERIRRVYCPNNTKEEFEKGFFLCPGCANASPDNLCVQKKCVTNKGIDKCVNCKQYPCDKAMAGLRDGIQPRSILADDVTWAILPYVPEQYGN